MKHVRWKMEWVFLLPLIAQWAIYFLLKDTLPVEIATHFTVENGKWIADDTMRPLNMMLVMTALYFVIYAVMSLSAYVAYERMTDNLRRVFWWMKLGILSFISAVDIHLLWGGARGQNDDMNIGLILFIFVFLNVLVFFIFRNAYGLDGKQAFAGLAGFAALFLLPAQYISTLILAVVLVGTGIPAIYSYLLYKQLNSLK